MRNLNFDEWANLKLYSDYKNIVRKILDNGNADVRNPNDDILLISSDYEYETVMKNFVSNKFNEFNEFEGPGIIIDIRPNKNKLIVSYNFWDTSLMMKLTEEYLIELNKFSLPEPKEIYILDLFEASIGIGAWDLVFGQSFGNPEPGYVEQLMYRCRELTDNTTVSLVNADINSDKSGNIRKAGRFDNYYSFPFGILYRTKARLLNFKTENSTMNYQASSKHFICMNAQININRINLVNYLHKENIVDTCHLSWLAVNNTGNRIKYERKLDEACFDYNTPIVLDVKPNELRIFSNQETVDKFYYLTDSLIDIGIETLSNPEDGTKDVRFITEKTWKPFLFGKIGFQFNYSGYYSDLETFGFELYDEIFDYSFDKIEDHGIRFKEYCKELKRISEIPVEVLTSRILLIEDKILNNRNHIWNYEFPRPTILKEYPSLGIGLTVPALELLMSKEYRNIIDTVGRTPFSDKYTVTNGEEEWVAHSMAPTTMDYILGFICLISSDEEYKDIKKLQNSSIIIDIRPEKNILLICNLNQDTVLIWKIVESYLKVLIHSSLPEPKEIYIMSLTESNLNIGQDEQVFNIDFDQVHSNSLKHSDNHQLQRLGHMEQLLYRCRELTTDTLINLVNPDVSLKNTSITRSNYLNRSERFDNYYSFPFGVLYRTKFRLRRFNEESSVMNYRTQPAKHFICMNAHPHYMRINLVNYLYKEKIVDTCHLSWLPSDHDGNLITKSDLAGEFFFDYNKVKMLDLNLTEVRTDKYETVDKFYYLTDSLIDIGIETYSTWYYQHEKDNRFITEKTWKPYLFGKIGFQFNYAGYYSDLEEFGFQLYDEIFDYSFDKIKDNNIRFEEYCKELKRISEISIEELTEKIISIERKILNNRNHIWNYEFPRPTILKEYPNLGIGLNE